MATPQGLPPLRFTGHQHLSTRLLLSTLTGRAIRISQIRPTSPTHPGLLPHEVSLLRLFDAVTNGSAIEFSYTGTTLLYKPGLITGTSQGYGANAAGVLRHELPAECARGVAYFLVPLCLLAPFAKAPLNVLLTGPGVVTSATAAGDPSADTVRTALLPLYAHFGVTMNLELRILRRSGPGLNGRGGAGEVQLVFGHQVRLPKTVHLQTPGRVKSIRGVAYAVGVGGASNARVIEAARGVLNPFAMDTYIFSDVSSAAFAAAKEPGQGNRGDGNAGIKRRIGVGFGLSLVAETSTGCIYSADVASAPAGGEAAEDIGRRCAYQLLEDISRGGCVNALGAETALILMAMGSEDVGRLQLGKDVVGSEEIVALARDLQTFGASGWGLRDSTANEGEVVVSVVGKGVGNVGRKIA